MKKNECEKKNVERKPALQKRNAEHIYEFMLQFRLSCFDAINGGYRIAKQNRGNGTALKVLWLAYAISGKMI